MSSTYVRVASASAIREGRSKRITVGSEELALWRAGGRFFAINNVCSHQHIAALHQGILDGLTVTCPMHGWTYSLETGVATSGSGRIKTYAVKVEGDDVFVECEET